MEKLGHGTNLFYGFPINTVSLLPVFWALLCVNTALHMYILCYYKHEHHSLIIYIYMVDFKIIYCSSFIRMFITSVFNRNTVLLL